MAIAAEAGSRTEQASPTAYRAKPSVIRQRALQHGLTTVSARALALYVGVNRKTMDRVLGGLSINPGTMTKIMHRLALDGDTIESLFEEVPPFPAYHPGSDD